MRAWKHLGTASEIERMLAATQWFRDSCVKEVWLESGNYVTAVGMDAYRGGRVGRARVYLQSTAIQNAVELRFDGLVEAYFVGAWPRFEAAILEASCFESNGLFFFAGAPNWNPNLPTEMKCSTAWFCAERLYWRQVDEQTGSSPYYVSDRWDADGVPFDASVLAARFAASLTEVDPEPCTVSAREETLVLSCGPAQVAQYGFGALLRQAMASALTVEDAARESVQDVLVALCQDASRAAGRPWPRRRFGGFATGQPRPQVSVRGGALRVDFVEDLGSTNELDIAL